MDISALKESGLTEGEIKVYLALLETGCTTTGPIVKKSGISRSIIYQILERLMQKGLVSTVIKEKTSYFQASQPGKILEFIEERQKLLSMNRIDVEKLLPELLLKLKSSNKSEVNMYHGQKGIFTAHEHAYQKLKKGEEYTYMGVYSYQAEEYHRYWQRDHLKRVKLGITTRILFNRDTNKNIVKNRNSFKGCDARYMPPGIKTPAWFMIYKDTVLIGLQHPNPIAVEIINKDIADSFMAYFEEYWKRSEKFKGRK